MDMYETEDGGATAPVLVNFHGGGFLLGKKQVKRLFCADMCLRGSLCCARSIRWHRMPASFPPVQITSMQRMAGAFSVRKTCYFAVHFTVWRRRRKYDRNAKKPPSAGGFR